MTRPIIAIGVFLLFLAPAAAHTAYVLTPDEMAAATQGSATFWTLLSSLTASEIATIVAVLLGLALLAKWLLFIKHYNPQARALFKRLEAHRLWVPSILRIVLGATLLVGGLGGRYFFSPDLPLTASVVGYAEAAAGLLLVLGVLTELGALLALIIFLGGFVIHGSVILDHLEIAGIAAVLLLWGGGRFRLETGLTRKMTETIERWRAPLRPHAIAILRWTVGLSFIIMGVMEKLAYPSISLAIAEKFDLAAQAGIRPEFFVLAAGLVEVGLGVLLLAGFLTRFVGVISFAVFTLTMLRFGEEVMPHLPLMAVFICLFMTGAQDPSVDRWLLRKRT